MRRLAEMGIFRGVRVKILSDGPWGGPVYIEILPTGARCSVGRGAASKIMVEVGECLSEPEEGDEICHKKHRIRGRGWYLWKRPR